jgi:hypothetical protein
MGPSVGHRKAPGLFALRPRAALGLATSGKREWAYSPFPPTMKWTPERSNRTGNSIPPMGRVEGSGRAASEDRGVCTRRCLPFADLAMGAVSPTGDRAGPQASSAGLRRQSRPCWWCNGRSAAQGISRREQPRAVEQRLAGDRQEYLGGHKHCQTSEPPRASLCTAPALLRGLDLESLSQRPRV